MTTNNLTFGSKSITTSDGITLNVGLDTGIPNSNVRFREGILDALNQKTTDILKTDVGYDYKKILIHDLLEEFLLSNRDIILPSQLQTIKNELDTKIPPTLIQIKQKGVINLDEIKDYYINKSILYNTVREYLNEKRNDFNLNQMPPSAADMARGFMDNSIASFDSNKENKINFNPNFQNAFDEISKKIDSNKSESILNLINEIGEYPDFLFQKITQNPPTVFSQNFKQLFTAIGLLTNGLGEDAKFSPLNNQISKIFLEGSKNTLTGGLGLLDIINAICSINPDVTSDKLGDLDDVFEGTYYKDNFDKIKNLSENRAELERELKQLSYKERQVYFKFNLITNLLNDAVKNHVNIYDFQDKINEIQSKYVKLTKTAKPGQEVGASGGENVSTGNYEGLKLPGSDYVSEQLKIATSQPLLLSHHQLYLYYINNDYSFTRLPDNSKYVAFDGIYYELTNDGSGLKLNGKPITSGQINSISDATKQEFEKIDKKMVETLNESLRKASEFVTTLTKIKKLIETTYTDTDKQKKQDSNDLKIFSNPTAGTPSNFYNDMVGNLLGKLQPKSPTIDKPVTSTIPFKQGLFLNHVMTYIENKLKFNEFKKKSEQPEGNVNPGEGEKAETEELTKQELTDLKKLIEENCAVSNSFYFVLEGKTFDLKTLTNIPEELKDIYKFYVGEELDKDTNFTSETDLFEKINEISQKQQKESGVLNINMVLDKKTKPEITGSKKLSDTLSEQDTLIKLDNTDPFYSDLEKPTFSDSKFNQPGSEISFFNQSQITYLDMDGIKIVSLPDAIGYLSNLKVLRLKGCSLIEIPETIGRLGNLQYLKLKDNFLTELPYSIGNCSNLIILDVRENCLYKNGSNANSGYKIPGSLTELMEFRAIDFEGIVKEYTKQASGAAGTAPAGNVKEVVNISIEDLPVKLYTKLKYNGGAIDFDGIEEKNYNPEENYVGYKLTIGEGDNKREISSYGFYFLYNHQKNKGDENYEHALQLVKNCFYGTEYEPTSSEGVDSVTIPTEITDIFDYPNLEIQLNKEINEKEKSKSDLQNNIRLNRLLDICLDVQSEGEYTEKGKQDMVMYHDLIKYIRLYEEFLFLQKKGNNNYKPKQLFFGEGSIDDKRPRIQLNGYKILEENKPKQDPKNLVEQGQEEKSENVIFELNDLGSIDTLYKYYFLESYKKKLGISADGQFKPEQISLPYFKSLGIDTNSKVIKPTMVSNISEKINQIIGKIKLVDLQSMLTDVIDYRIEEMMYEEMDNIYSEYYKVFTGDTKIYEFIINKIENKIQLDKQSVKKVVDKYNPNISSGTDKIYLYTLGFRLYHSTDVSTFLESIEISEQEITEAKEKNESPGVTLTDEEREKIIKELKLEKLIEAYDEIKDKFDSNIFTERQKKKSIETEIIKMIMDLEDIDYDSNYNHRRKEEVEELWKIDAEINSLNEKIKTPKPEGVTTLADEQQSKIGESQKKIQVLTEEKTKLGESVDDKESITKKISEGINNFNDNNKKLFLTYNYVLQHLPDNTTNRNKILDAVKDKSKLNYEKYFEVERDIRISLDFPEYILTGNQINGYTDVKVEDDLTTYYNSITGLLKNKSEVEAKIDEILSKEKIIAEEETQMQPNISVKNRLQLQTELNKLQSELNKLQDELAELNAEYK